MATLAKASWADSRYEQPKGADADLTGGTVEVFANETDLKNRKEYIEAAVKGMPILNQYMYVKGTALMRISREIKPSQAKEYEAVLNK